MARIKTDSRRPYQSGNRVMCDSASASGGSHPIERFGCSKTAGRGQSGPRLCIGYQSRIRIGSGNGAPDEHSVGSAQSGETLSEAGVPVGVMTAPIVPGLNDTELPQLLKTAKEAG